MMKTRFKKYIRKKNSLMISAAKSVMGLDPPKKNGAVSSITGSAQEPKEQSEGWKSEQIAKQVENVKKESKASVKESQQPRMPAKKAKRRNLRDMLYDLSLPLKRFRKHVSVGDRISYLLPAEGQLPWWVVINLATRNLLYNKSRTFFTVGAIALGTAAIVFLVSFAYGLQDIVVNRLITPDSLRIIDVQSDSTNLALDKEYLDEIAQLSGIESVNPSISMAATLEFQGSETEVITMALNNQYMYHLATQVVAGEQFSDDAEAQYTGTAEDLEELVAIMDASVLGEADVEDPDVGDAISEETVYYRVLDYQYIPVRNAPSNNAVIIGYTSGSVLKKYVGIEVWGDPYQSISTVGKNYLREDGEWLGRWLDTKVPFYYEEEKGKFAEAETDSGDKVQGEGYIQQANVYILSAEEVKTEELLDTIFDDEASGVVLGDEEVAEDVVDEVDEPLEVEVINTANTEVTDEEIAALKEIVAFGEEEELAQDEIAFVEVKKQGGKEILISTFLANTWDIKPEELIGKTMNMRFIITGNLIPGVSGRVTSDSVEYTIAGVFYGDKKALAYVPIADAKSMGIERYTIAKVLADDSSLIGDVRARIEALGFSTQSISDTLAQVDKLFAFMRFIMAMVGLLALTVALIGMFNTLTVSLLERTREVGVMKTLGTANRDIVRLFVTESLVISLLGGIVGVALGLLAAEAVDILLNILRGGYSVSMFSTPVPFLVLILIISLVVGFVTGIYPAVRARKINALNALRYE